MKHECLALLKEVPSAKDSLKERQLQEPINEGTILLEKEATDTFRINSLEFSVIKLKIASNRFMPPDLETGVQESYVFNDLEQDQELNVHL